MFPSWPLQAFAGEQEKRFFLLFPGLAWPVVISYEHLGVFLHQLEQSPGPPVLLHLFSEQFLRALSGKVISPPWDAGKRSAEDGEGNSGTFLVIPLVSLTEDGVEVNLSPVFQGITWILQLPGHRAVGMDKEVSLSLRGISSTGNFWSLPRLIFSLEVSLAKQDRFCA